MLAEPTTEKSGDRPLYIIPFDEYIYRKIADLCLDFITAYVETGTGTKSSTGSVSKMENLFETLMDFAAETEALPEDLKNPPVGDWELSPDNIHPRLALNYVMRLLNELKRQQAKKGREPDFYTKNYSIIPA